MPQEADPLLSSMSGSLASITYSHNQYGPYTRNRTVPTDPDTLRQRRTRLRWGQAGWRWLNALTPADRRSWNVYAAQLRKHATPARPYVLSGQQAHQRANVSRAIPPLGWISQAPSTFTDSLWTVPAFSTFGTTGFVFLTIDPADEWANQDFAAMICYVSAIHPATINFFKGPFKRAGVIRGFTASPPAADNFFVDPWGTAPTVRRWARTLTVMADGRVSVSHIRPFDDNV